MLNAAHQVKHADQNEVSDRKGNAEDYRAGILMQIDGHEYLHNPDYQVRKICYSHHHQHQMILDMLQQLHSMVQNNVSLIV